MSITVLKPGLLSSFQDLGRYGYQHLGVPVGGAMDERAHRIANWLVGNEDAEATLEVTLVGPTLRFESATCIAITGADLSPTINGAPVPNYRPLVLRPADVLAFGARQTGLRAYIAYRGGVELESVLDSQSTYIRGGLGGMGGRALKPGDVLRLRAPLTSGKLDERQVALSSLRIYLPAALGLRARPALRAMRGPHTPLFTPESVAAFFNSEFRVSAQSERMGYRLQGPTLTLKSRDQQLSEAVSFGSVQVPPDGQAIILTADRQTTGGYAKIAHVASADLPQLAQLMPGEALRFSEVSVDEAMDADYERELAMQSLRRRLVEVADWLS